MHKTLRLLGLVALPLALSEARAASFEPNFSDYPFPGTQYTVDAAANSFFSVNYGITVDNAYLYKDSRDTFDGIGVSAGTVPEIGSTQTGVITFLDTTNFVSFDYWGILPTTYQALDSHGNVLDTLNIGSGALGTFEFSGGTIAELTWTSLGGYGQVTGLRYDYDGKTDGHNTDLVPDTANSGLLLALGLGSLVAIRRRSQR